MDALPLFIMILVLAGIALTVWLYRRRKGGQPSEVHAYFHHLCGEYYALPSDPARDERTVEHITQIIEKAKKEKVDWDDLFEFELLLLRLLPNDKLERKAWLIQKRWRSVVRPETVTLYEKSLKKEGPKDHGELLADLEVLLQDLFWHYRMSSAWEEQSGKFANTGWLCLLIALLAGGILFGVNSTFNPPWDWNIVFTTWAVAFAGALGGLLSMLRRLKAVSDEMHRSSQLIAIENSRLSIILQALLTGASFALVLWLMFTGDFISGNLFPKELKGLASWDANAAKLLVWSFVAGFAEKLVPDLLDHLSKAQVTEKTVTEEKKVSQTLQTKHA